MAKLSKEQKEELKNVGVTGVTTVEGARKKLIKYLQDNELEDVENDSLSDLIQFAEAYYEEEGADEEEELEEIEEAEEIEEEEELEEIEEEEELEEIEEEKIYDKLAEEIEEETDPNYTKSTVKELRAICIKKNLISVAAAAKIRLKKPFLELLENKEDKTPPKKKATKKPKEEAKKAPKATKTTSANKKIIFDGRGNEDHLEQIEKLLEEFYPKEEYEYKILKQGVTVRALLENARPTVVNYDELKIVDGEFIGNLYFYKIKSVEELCTLIPESFHERKMGMFRGEAHPSLKKVTEEEFKLLMKGKVMEEIHNRCGVEDKRLGKEP